MTPDLRTLMGIKQTDPLADWWQLTPQLLNIQPATGSASNVYLSDHVPMRAKDVKFLNHL